jgi:hypothetical protein
MVKMAMLSHRMTAGLTADLESVAGHGCMNESGLARRPTSNAREKLRVASDDRNIPSRIREKHLISWYC